MFTNVQALSTSKTSWKRSFECETSVTLVRLSCNNVAINKEHKVRINIYICIYIYIVYIQYIYSIYIVYIQHTYKGYSRKQTKTLILESILTTVFINLSSITHFSGKFRNPVIQIPLLSSDTPYNINPAVHPIIYSIYTFDNIQYRATIESSHNCFC